MQLTSSPHVAERETDSGWKSGYYAAILSGKTDHGIWSLSTVEKFVSSFLTSAESDFTFIPRMCKVSTGSNAHWSNKLTCMPRWCSELAKCFTILKLHRPWSSLPLKMATLVSGFLSAVHFRFGYVRYCIRSIPIWKPERPKLCLKVLSMVRLLLKKCWGGTNHW